MPRKQVTQIVLGEAVLKLASFASRDETRNGLGFVMIDGDWAYVTDGHRAAAMHLPTANFTTDHSPVPEPARSGLKKRVWIHFKTLIRAKQIQSGPPKRERQAILLEVEDGGARIRVKDSFGPVFLPARIVKPGGWVDSLSDRKNKTIWPDGDEEEYKVFLDANLLSDVSALAATMTPENPAGAAPVRIRFFGGTRAVEFGFDDTSKQSRIILMPMRDPEDRA